MIEQQGFRQLIVYQKAFKLAVWLHKASERFPKDEKFGGITDQMRRSSRGICSNLAEGFGRWSTTAEERRFLSIAMGSVEETCVWLDFCLEFGYLSVKQVEELQQSYSEVRKMLKSMLNRRK